MQEEKSQAPACLDESRAGEGRCFGINEEVSDRGSAFE